MISTSTQTNAPSTTMIEIQEGGPGYSCHIVLAKRSICRIDLSFFAICYPGPPDHHNSANLKMGKKFCYLFEILFLIHSTKTI